MITLITGKKASGKRSMVKKITNGARTVYVPEYGLEHPFWTSMNEIKADVKFIVIDEATDASKLKELFNDTLTVSEALKKEYSISTPDIIIVSQTITDLDDVSFSHIDMDIEYDNINWRMRRK